MKRSGSIQERFQEYRHRGFDFDRVGVGFRGLREITQPQGKKAKSSSQENVMQALDAFCRAPGRLTEGSLGFYGSGSFTSGAVRFSRCSDFSLSEFVAPISGLHPF
jgi:hypothetical protein